jgi:uroporphyrinogen-III decarboxylase
LGWVNIFETLHAVRKFDDVLVDLMDDSPEINRLADIVAGYQLKCVNYYAALGADGIMFADDWGSQNSLLINPDVWRRFFQPRYARIMAPAKKAGVDVFFHSCGHVIPLFDDLADLGINVIWPQLGNNDNKTLAKKCRQRKICIELHMDRQRLMSFARAEEIDRAVAEARKTFGSEDGGLIFHAEIDNGFAFERVEALLRAFEKYA